MDNGIPDLRNQPAPRLFWTVSALIVILGALARLVGLERVGVEGNDTFYYWNVAERWAQVSPNWPVHYRPLYYWLCSVAFQLTGGAQYGLKLVSALSDIATLVLIAALGRRLRLSHLATVLALAAYAFNPTAIEYARVELPQALSTLTIMAAVYCSAAGAVAAPNERRLFILGAGFAIACALNSHPDLVVAALICIIPWIREQFFPESKSAPLMRRLVSLGSTALWSVTGAFLGMLPVLKWRSAHALLQNLLRNSEGESGLPPDAGYLDAAWLLINDTLTLYGMPLIALGILSCAAIVTTVLGRRKRERPEWFLLGLGAHFIAIVILASRNLVSRVFLPWMPLVWLCVFLWLEDVVVFLSRRFSHEPRRIFGVLGCSTLMLVVDPFPRNVYIVSPLVEAFNAIKDDIDQSHRVLVGPMALNNVRGPLTSAAYFGSRATYLSSIHDAALDDVVAKYSVRYFIWFKVQVWPKAILPQPEVQEAIEAVYGTPRGTFTMKAEEDLLRAWLERCGATLERGMDSFDIYRFAAEGPCSLIRPKGLGNTLAAPNK